MDWPGIGIALAGLGGALISVVVAIQRIQKPQLDLLFGQMSDSSSRLSAEIATLRTDLSADVAALRAELSVKVESLRSDLGADISTLTKEVYEMKGTLGEMQRNSNP